MFDQFYNMIIKDGAYITIFKGLKTTLVISVFGLFFATMVGAVLCAMSRSRSRMVRGIERLYTVVMRGTPVLMILMLLFYVIFAKSRMDASIVAVIGFSLNTGAHIGEIMKSAMNAVDQGQVNAARTLGFSAVGAFFNVTLPQAVIFARPVYQNAIINLVQWTSVVGYITIADLTRVVNNLGARHAKPFFAMFVGIVLYLAIAAVINGIFRLTENKRRPVQ